MKKTKETTLAEFNEWTKGDKKVKEGYALEFKEARNNFNIDKDLTDYCAGISNTGGGKLLLDVDDTGKVVGSTVFSGRENKLPHILLQKIGLNVGVEEFEHPDGRVLIFHIPSRPRGQVIMSSGKYKYPIRVGESLVEMDTMTLKGILNEAEADFSSLIAKDFLLADIDDAAIENFKVRWGQKAKREDYRSYQHEKILRSNGLLSDKGLNYACLILFGKKEKLDELMPGSEIIYEWREDSKKTDYDYRASWREPFFKVHNAVWDTINARNIRFSFQERLFQREIFAFNEKAIREAVLNAVTHRDYAISNRSVFIKASPQGFFIESPGGLPYGITVENILRETSWRNRLIAETFEKSGLVERSGQGMDDIFQSTIKEGKGLPDLSGSDNFSVRLRIPAQVKDKNFVLFIEKIANEKQVKLSFDEILELEKIREGQPVKHVEHKNRLLEIGLIERVGRTIGAKYILSHKYYAHIGKVGLHTRFTGIERDKIKELIIKHLGKNKGFLRDLKQAFPELKPMDISNLLQELKREGKIRSNGWARASYWELNK